ncbi:MAG: GTPase HflX, partial [Planctomycetales bacterium]|nr:GTPase HflX [Planctomycetales bacterium]
ELPHRLIASFKATLEEARQADLLLHVADGSNPDVFNQISAVFDVLAEIGIEEKDTLLIINKIDRSEADGLLEGIMNRYPNAVPISARAGMGLKDLAGAVSEALSRTFRDVDVEMQIDNGRLMAYLAQHGEVLSKSFHENRATLHCRLPQKFLGRIHDPTVTIREHERDGDAKPEHTPEAVASSGNVDAAAIEEVA